MSNTPIDEREALRNEMYELKKAILVRYSGTDPLYKAIDCIDRRLTRLELGRFVIEDDEPTKPEIRRYPSGTRERAG